jgi:thiol:disulfide interchange protein DsbC
MKKLLLWSLGLIYSLGVNAAVDNLIEQSIRGALKQKLPDLAVDAILPTPVAGIYEVDSGRKVFYTSTDASYIFIGNLIDLTTKTSLTEQRSNSLNKINWQKLPIKLAVRHIAGSNNANQRHIAVFTDPDCPFCKRLEAETLSKLQDVSIYYFLFPLKIHKDAAEHALKILCAENPESALISFMGKDMPLGKNASCISGVRRLFQMQKIATNLVQVAGTPTIILPNGRIISGLVPADYLKQMIDGNQLESATDPYFNN